MAIKILICDDQDLVCEGLKAILSTDAELEVVGTAYDGCEALELLPKCRPDLALMDLKMPGMDGVQATRRIRQEHPNVKVLVLTTYDADQWVFDAIRAGASGYILKDTPREGLIAAIKDAVAGKTPVDPAIAGRLFDHIARQAPAPDTAIADSLSEREKEVLRLLARGLSNADIAEKIYLSEGTVRNYVSSIFAKLGVSDRTQAAVLAIRYGLADLSDG
ncbi:MAG: response regulator transcription factor [Anaerolineales bacterium]|nr:response regulator transcription factor [Anaerolineales bacterium]